jgi:hypothetical protein
MHNEIYVIADWQWDSHLSAFPVVNESTGLATTQQGWQSLKTSKRKFAVWARHAETQMTV